MPRLIIPRRAWFATLALGCAGLVSSGLTLQHLLSLAPCPLCIFQRVLYMAIAGVGLLGLAWPSWHYLWRVLVGLASGLGVCVAGYQSWMQAFPKLATECGYADPNLIERLVDWLGMQWPGLFLATGFCTSRDWEFLGMSMANWSVLVFAACLVGVFSLGREGR